jgi:hypothetical protein
MNKLLRSVGIPLGELFENPSDILGKITECQDRVNKKFNIVFYNESYDTKSIDALFKKHKREISELNVSVTKNLDDGSFFHINVIPVHRFGYSGNIIDGLDHFIKLLQHVDIRVEQGSPERGYK